MRDNFLSLISFRTQAQMKKHWPNNSFFQTAVNKGLVVHGTAWRCPLHGCLVQFSLETPAPAAPCSGPQLTQTWALLTAAGRRSTSHPISALQDKFQPLVHKIWCIHCLCRRSRPAVMARYCSTGLYQGWAAHWCCFHLYQLLGSISDKKWVVCNCSQRCWALSATKWMHAVIIPCHRDCPF